ncbi:recombinase family protein [Dokdonia sp.]|uniref:recombinase family protein n=1 Tax=Dokdonia sp. TaxID=2024995 RepID=UPI003264B54D
MVFGYARISSESQKLDIQIDRFELLGIEKNNIYADEDSGAKNDRKELEKLLSKLRKGDKVIFYDLTRLGRSVKYLITLIEHFGENGIHFQDITNPAINTESVETPEGELIFYVFAIIGQFMRKQSNEKVRAGLESARRRGKFGGRPKGLSARIKEKAPVVAIMWKNPTTSLSQICKAMKIAPNTVYKCLDHEGVDRSLHHKNKGNNNRIKNSKIEFNKE